jgi:hypothetical protein
MYTCQGHRLRGRRRRPHLPARLYGDRWTLGKENLLTQTAVSRSLYTHSLANANTSRLPEATTFLYGLVERRNSSAPADDSNVAGSRGMVTIPPSVGPAVRILQPEKAGDRRDAPARVRRFRAGPYRCADAATDRAGMLATAPSSEEESHERRKRIRQH